jgi:hypothetical protein
MNRVLLFKPFCQTILANSQVIVQIFSCSILSWVSTILLFKGAATISPCCMRSFYSIEGGREMLTLLILSTYLESGASFPFLCIGESSFGRLDWSAERAIKNLVPVIIESSTFALHFL